MHAAGTSQALAHGRLSFPGDPAPRSPRRAADGLQGRARPAHTTPSSTRTPAHHRNSGVAHTEGWPMPSSPGAPGRPQEAPPHQAFTGPCARPPLGTGCETQWATLLELSSRSLPSSCRCQRRGLLGGLLGVPWEREAGAPAQWRRVPGEGRGPGNLGELRAGGRGRVTQAE